MSTLSLEDLGPRMRRKLGLEASCPCGGMKKEFVATLPVIEAGPLRASKPVREDQPGAAWLRTGLHRLRIPALQPPPAKFVKRQEDYW